MNYEYKHEYEKSTLLNESPTDDLESRARLATQVSTGDLRNLRNSGKFEQTMVATPSSETTWFVMKRWKV
jgi:hypothetical protein